MEKKEDWESISAHHLTLLWPLSLLYIVIFEFRFALCLCVTAAVATMVGALLPWLHMCSVPSECLVKENCLMKAQLFRL